MRRGGTVRGVFAGFLGLVALHALGTKGGSGRVKEAFGDVAGLIERVLDADVPAIPDRRGRSTPTDDAAPAAGTTRLPVPSVPKAPATK